MEPLVHCDSSALPEALPLGAGTPGTGRGGGGRAAKALVLSKSSSWCVCAPGKSWCRSPTDGTVTGASGE